MPVAYLKGTETMTIMIDVPVLGVPMYAGTLADAVRHVIETCLRSSPAAAPRDQKRVRLQLL
jgi:hypothetical protein